MVEDGHKPTLKQLQGLIDNPTVTGAFNLKPTFEVALPERTLEEDLDVTLALNAQEAYSDELREHPEFLTKRSKLRFIKKTLKYEDRKTAKLLGITTNQVERQDLRGRRKEEVERFDQRFNGLFALSSILERNFHGYIGAVVDRRVALETPNGKLSEMSVNMAVERGYINVAVAIALETVRQNRETMDFDPHFNNP
ncbi:MAG TPA: hypothetical protein VES68_02970 [Candidatus Sulfotelmatobacter sp.]|nr:hypothetical protein [Candidatus Sulfotelmatobacter sp.]